MKLLKLNYLWMFMALSVLVACGGDDDDGGAVECTQTVVEAQYETLTTAYAEAFGAYIFDQSTANCEAFKSASEDYIEFLEDNESCLDDLGFQFEDENENPVTISEAIQNLKTVEALLGC